MNQQEQNKIRNYLLRRIDPETLKTIIETNFDFAKREWDPDYEFHNFNYGIATIIVDDLHNYDYIDLLQDLNIYNRLIDYFYIVLEKKSKKLFNKLNDDYNNQEEHIINETNFFQRRVDLDRVEHLLKLHADQVFGETESYKQFKYELTLRAVEAIIWQDYELGWEELPEQEEIDYVNMVSDLYEDTIKKLYNHYKTKR